MCSMITRFLKGCYMFSLHLCTHDMKKALVAIRRNGVEVATVFDQVHWKLKKILIF